MSRINFQPELFLETQELNRFQSFLKEEGFKRHLLQNTESFGIVKNKFIDSNFLYGRVQDGTNASTIKVNETFALDKNGNLIYKPFEDNIVVNNDGNYYWVVLTYKESTEEEGIVSIDNQGNLTGVGTKFTQVLRSNNFRSRITLSNAINNTLDYEVLEVIDDENAVLVGAAFSAENNLKYSVTGTFSPGSVQSSSEKFPFRYDNATISLIQETTLNTKPSTIEENVDFVLARVIIQSGQVVIEDKRNEFVKTKASFDFSFVDSNQNRLIGVESIRYNSQLTTKDKNLVTLGWGFRSNNWTINSNLNRVTINAGNGGVFKTTSQFTNGDFDGWRLYSEQTGKLHIIVSSVKTGNQINLELESLDPDDFIDITKEVSIVPNSEEIEIKFIKDPSENSVDLNDQVFTYNIRDGFAEIPVLVYSQSGASYIVEYRYKTLNNYTKFTLIPSDPTGYYNESAFNSDGTLINNTLAITPYTSSQTVSFINLQLDPASYINFKNSISTGDLIGVSVTQFDNLNPVKTLVVGEAKQNQYFSSEITLNTDNFINLSSQDTVDGNEFFIRIDKVVDLQTFRLRIVQDFVNTGNVGTELKEFSQHELNRAETDPIYIKATYSVTESQWILVDQTDSLRESLTNISIKYNQNALLPSNVNAYIAEGCVVTFQAGVGYTISSGVIFYQDEYYFVNEELTAINDLSIPKFAITKDVGIKEMSLVLSTDSSGIFDFNTITHVKNIIYQPFEMKYFSGFNTQLSLYFNSGIGIDGTAWEGFYLMNGQNVTTHWGNLSDAAITAPLPDMRGRFPVGFQDITNSDNNLFDNNYRIMGATGGSKEHRLDVNQIPSHNHTMPNEGIHDHYVVDDDDVPDINEGALPEDRDASFKRIRGWGNYDADSSGGNSRARRIRGGRHSHTINNTGGTGFHNNTPAYLVTYPAIRIPIVTYQSI